MEIKYRKLLAPICALLAAILVIFPLCSLKNASAAGTQAMVVLSDLDDCLTEAEEKALLEKMTQTSKETGINIGIVITADLENKRANRYADNFSDNNFGIESNSIVLLLLNTHDLPIYDMESDWISTSGKARKLYDNKIDKIFSRVYAALEKRGIESDLPGKPNVYKNWSSTNYYLGCMNFCTTLEKYGNPVSAFWYGILDFVFSNIPALFLGGIVGLIVALIFSSNIKRSYSKKSPISAAQYIDKRNTEITRREDVFIREYTTSYRRSSSSGGGRSGGGGGGSHGGGGGHHR